MLITARAPLGSRRRHVLLWAEIVASLPNLALYLWWVFDDFSIWIYYVVRGAGPHNMDYNPI